MILATRLGQDTLEAMSEPLRLRVLFFARAHELAGAGETSLELDAPATVRDADAALRDAHPWMAEKLATYRIAVDEEFAKDDTPLHDGAVLAIIPPVSGG